MNLRCIALAVLLALTGCAHVGVQISRESDGLRVGVNGKLVTKYHYENTPRPYFYPLLGPDDLPMTRRWPMEATTNEEHDHPHHRSLWYAHSSVNGLDFWSETSNACKIVHEKFSKIKSGNKFGTIES